MADLDPGAEVVGSPAQPVRAFFKEIAVLRKLVRDRSRARATPQAAASQDNEDVS